jgi:hypothetical protein
MKKLFSHKNKILAGYLLIAISTFVSCKKLIEIPANPQTQITRQEQFSDSASTISAVAGVYSYIYGGGIPYSDANLTFTTSLSGNEISSNLSYGNYGAFSSYTVIPSNSEVSTLWSEHYSSLYAVNDVLAGITNNKNLSASFVKQITGEMEVTRAFYYFYLVNLFGSVPLVTTTNYTTNAQLPQATKAAVYTQILTDLNDAIKKLPASYPSSGRARPNLYTAIALKAKVHLYQGNWHAAYAEADSVINSNLYSVVATPLSGVFLDGSQEAIWQLPIESQYSGTAEAQQFLPYFNGQTPNFPVTDSLLAQFEPTDQRLTNYMGASAVDSVTTSYYPAKYKDQQPTSPATDYMMLRLAEQYLIRAEAAAEIGGAGNLNQALSDVNVIRNRAGLANSNAEVTSQKAVLAAIRKERRTELCFEWGNRWFDLNRTINDTNYPSSGNITTVLTGYSATKDDVYPIPQAQLLLNTHLKQNPNYH